MKDNLQSEKTTSIMKYRKKPVVIEAMQLTYQNWDDVCDFITVPWGPSGVHGCYHKEGVGITDSINDKLALVIPTLEGDHLALENDYIIKGVKGEFYPCKPDIFAMTYEKVI